MNLLAVFRFLGLFFILFATLFIVPLIFACYQEKIHGDSLFPPTANSFFISFVLTVLFGFLLWVMGKSAAGKIMRREGILLVVLIWFIVPFFSGLPFIFSGTLQHPLHAYFEMVSGFTTTGSTILQAKKFDPINGEEIPYSKKVPGVFKKKTLWYGTVEPIRDQSTGEIIFEGVEAVAPPLLFWRALTQWIGGGGVIVLLVAVLPLLGVGGKFLFQTEVPGPMKEGMAPRIKETAIKLWKTYFFLSLALLFSILLFVKSVPFFDALCLTCTTLSTGGFSVTNQSIASYHSTLLEVIIEIFMVIGAVNFALLYQVGRGRIYKLFQVEFFLFLGTLIALSIIVSLFLAGTVPVDLQGKNLSPLSRAEAFHYAAFQVISTVTTTGFATVNYDLWPYFPQVVLLLASFLGGMSGSTAGGIKMMRHIILFKIAQYKVEGLFSPRSVKALRIEGKVVNESAFLLTLVFFLLIIALSAVGTLLYVADGLDPETALGLVACMVNNVGLSFRLAGPLDSCAFLSDFGLILSSLLMIAGRLEFFALLAIITPVFWKSKG